MMSKMHKRLVFVIVGLVYVVGVLVAWVTPSAVTASGFFSTDEFGSAVSSSLKEIKRTNNELLLNSKEEDSDVIAWVDNVPIRESEFQFRKSLDALSPKPREDSELLSVLVKEKIRFVILNKNNLEIDEKEISEYLDLEKSFDGMNEYVKELCKNAAISEEEYWEIYERYNVIRIIADEKVFKLFLESNKIELDYGEAVMSSEVIDKYDKWLDSCIENADVRITAP